ncbi:MAG: LysR family transcriptional regulator [Phycisphaerae bacterium]|nr:LysR family transcriptional regulator [Phycisphaerae bacterium]
MDMKQIKIFCDLVETKSFSKAAAMNYISQSAVSQQVKALESQLRLQLVDRSCRPLALTHAGNICYQGCKQIYEKYEELHNQLAAFAHEITGAVTIAGIASIVLYLLQPYVRYFLQRYPNVRLRIEPMRANQAVDAVLEDRADIGMVACPKEDRRMGVIDLCRERLVLTMHPSNPLAQKKKVAIKDLHDQPMIHFERDQSTRKLIESILRRNEVSVKIVMEQDNIETMKRGVEAGIGISILPEPAIVRELQIGTIVGKPFAEKELHRPVGIIYRKGRAFSEPVKRLLEILKEPAPKIEESLAPAAVPAQ